jgi:hypothetical protein
MLDLRLGEDGHGIVKCFAGTAYLFPKAQSCVVHLTLHLSKPAPRARMSKTWFGLGFSIASEYPKGCQGGLVDENPSHGGRR